jgi:peroxiredoxin
MESISSYSGGGISVIAVSLLGNDTTTARDIAEKYDISFPILIDPTAEVYEKYGGAKLPPGTCPVNPQFFVVNHGRVTYATHFPSAPIDEIRAAVDKATALPKPGDSTGSGYKYQKNQPDDPQDSTDH